VQSLSPSLATVPDSEGQALPGLVWAFRFKDDGTAEELACGEPIEGEGGWLWLHFNLADARACRYLKAEVPLPPTAVELLASPDPHQQFHGTGSCLYGIFSDLVRGLGGITGEIGSLHFAMTEKLFVTGRRERLNAVEATRQLLQSGRKILSSAALLETIIESVAEAVEDHADALAEELDDVEERLVAQGLSNQQQSLARARRLAVRLHRLLSTQRSLIHRFERDTVQQEDTPLRVETSKLSQRLDWLDQEMVLRDRAHLLQEEVSLKMADQTNRNLQILAIVTTVFLPATLITGIFGMNVGGLPLVSDHEGFLWAMVLLAGASVFVFWLLKKAGLFR
jgi:zinc transporter